MQLSEFWQLIDRAKTAAGDDIEQRPDALQALLEALEPEQIQAFQIHYEAQLKASYRWDLWGAAYLMNGGCSDDGFRYFQDWLISEGEQVFAQVLQDPDSLADLATADELEDGFELESFGYAAMYAYQALGGGELERDVSLELSMPDGEEWDEDALPTMFPKLAGKYAA